MKHKNPVGRPKSDNPKIRSTFRLSDEVTKLIRSKKNQATYLESLVLNDQATKLLRNDV